MHRVGLENNTQNFCLLLSSAQRSWDVDAGMRQAPEDPHRKRRVITGSLVLNALCAFYWTMFVSKALLGSAPSSLFAYKWLCVCLCAYIMGTPVQLAMKCTFFRLSF